MEKRTKTITIGRNQYGFYYRDSSHEINEIAMLEAFGMLVARLAGTIQYSADMEHDVEYTIDITKTMNE